MPAGAAGVGGVVGAAGGALLVEGATGALLLVAGAGALLVEEVDGALLVSELVLSASELQAAMLAVSSSGRDRRTRHLEMGVVMIAYLS